MEFRGYSGWLLRGSPKLIGGCTLKNMYVYEESMNDQYCVLGG